MRGRVRGSGINEVRAIEGMVRLARKGSLMNVPRVEGKKEQCVKEEQRRCSSSFMLEGLCGIEAPFPLGKKTNAANERHQCRI